MSTRLCRTFDPKRIYDRVSYIIKTGKFNTNRSATDLPSGSENTADRLERIGLTKDKQACPATDNTDTISVSVSESTTQERGIASIQKSDIALIHSEFSDLIKDPEASVKKVDVLSCYRTVKKLQKLLEWLKEDTLVDNVSTEKKVPKNVTLI